MSPARKWRIMEKRKAERTAPKAPILHDLDAEIPKHVIHMPKRKTTYSRWWITRIARRRN